MQRTTWLMTVVTFSLASVLASACGSDDEGGSGGTGGKKADSGTGGAGNGGTGGGVGGGGTGGVGLTGGSGGSDGGGAGGVAGAGGAGGAAGSGGSAGSAGSTGTDSGVDSGSGGSDASTGGADSGSGGTDGGVEDGGSPVSLCGCTLATAEDHTGNASTTVTFVPYAYTPSCIKIKAGSSVTWSGAFTSHPLTPFALLGTQPNPIPLNALGTTLSVPFPSAGDFGYRCGLHGAESETGGSMCGAVFVVP